MERSKIDNLPKVRVSFQDQFCGCGDEVTTTVQYVFNELLKKSIKPHIGLKILLWENDSYDEIENYICQIGEIARLGIINKHRFYAHKFPSNYFVRLGNRPVMIKIKRDDYFFLSDLKIN